MFILEKTLAQTLERLHLLLALAAPWYPPRGAAQQALGFTITHLIKKVDVLQSLLLILDISCLQYYTLFRLCV